MPEWPAPEAVGVPASVVDGDGIDMPDMPDLPAMSGAARAATDPPMRMPAISSREQAKPDSVRTSTSITNIMMSGVTRRTTAIARKASADANVWQPD